MTGQKKGFVRLVDELHEKHKTCDEKQIEAQIKTMTKYEKRGADKRLK